MREFFIRLSELDRRWVFLGVAVVTIFPLFVPLGLPPPEVSPYTQMVFDEIEKCGPEAAPILLSMDYDPATIAELQPMAEAILRHIFARQGKVIVLTFNPTGAGLAQDALYRVADEFRETGIEEGKHYANLGFNAPVGVCILGIGENFRNNYPVATLRDGSKAALDDLPIFKGVKNYADILIVVDLAGNNIPTSWIALAHERHRARFTMGVTNVMAADFTPYVGKQSQGMIQGMVGAAEYEQLMMRHRYWPTPEDATKGMDSQGTAHAYILLLILIGNTGYFLARGRKGGAQ